VRNLFDYQAKPENQRLRFAVLDVPSGQIGAIDVPAHPQHYGALPAPTVSGDAPLAAAAPATRPAPPVPAAAPPPPTHVGFRGSNGATSMLDWTGDSVVYHGELTIDQGAHALFGTLFAGRNRCEAGSLVPNDISASGKPSLVLTLRKADGRSAVIDLEGSAPAYAGELAVDPGARAFFDDLWKLCHCQQP
jgi:hypothetical protein